MSRIPESELILNERGAIYHLNLKPDELAGTIILVGDPGRVTEVSRYFDRIELKHHHREFVSHIGLLNKKRIIVTSTGIGTDNIDITLNELDALANIDFETREIKAVPRSLNLLRIGTCGALQQDIPVDSFVVSTHGLGIDNLLNYYRLDQNEEEKQLLHSFVTQTQIHSRIGYPYIAGAAGSLLKHFVGNFHQGITITCPGFYAPQGRVLRLGLSNPDLNSRLSQFSFGQYRIANFEMETSAIYGLGKLMGHRCLSLNVVVANRVRKEFSKDHRKAVDGLIVKALEIIDENILK